MTLPTQVKFNIPQLFKDAFGIYTRFPIYVLGGSDPRATSKAKQEGWPLDSKYFLEPGELATYKGNQKPYGVLVWDSFGIKHPDLPDSAPIFYLPLVTTVEVTQSKEIVKTKMAGKNGTIKGTVKELMSVDDHVLIFRGLVINFNEPNKYPEREVEQLNKLFDINASLSIESKIMEAHGITDIVFTNRSWPDSPGMNNVQPFEFTALSDDNIILELTQ